MNRTMMLTTACAALVCGVTLAADEDPVDKQLANAKAGFEKSAEKARSRADCILS